MGGQLDGIQWVIDQVKEAVTTDGNLLVFLSLTGLALGSVVARDWRWKEHQIKATPYIVGRDMRRYHYRRMEGGKQVRIYLPTGRMVVHHTTASAVGNNRQLADEVSTLVNDLYVTNPM